MFVFAALQTISFLTHAQQRNDEGFFRNFGLIFMLSAAAASAMDFGHGENRRSEMLELDKIHPLFNHVNPFYFGECWLQLQSYWKKWNKKEILCRSVSTIIHFYLFINVSLFNFFHFFQNSVHTKCLCRLNELTPVKLASQTNIAGRRRTLGPVTQFTHHEK